MDSHLVIDGVLAAIVAIAGLLFRAKLQGRAVQKADDKLAQDKKDIAGMDEKELHDDILRRVDR